MARREVGEDEHMLWEDVTRDVRPTSRSRKPTTRVAAPSLKNPITRAAGSKPSAPRQAPPKAQRDPAVLSGVDGATAERLKRGKVEPDAKLDLHGMTQAQAHARLLTFVRRAHDDSLRCLLVITGKGSPGRTEAGGGRGFVMPERSKAGILRELVPFWLEDAQTRGLVVGIQAAHPRHGGAGALYVYLRRKRVR